MEVTNRPLSPHITIYKPQLTSVLSIAHRGTGVFLTIGTLFLVYWMYAVAQGPEAYASAQTFFGSWLGRLILAAWSFALFYHLCNGIRHLFWDAGIGFEIKSAYASGTVVVVVSILLTVVSWLVAYGMRGAGS